MSNMAYHQRLAQIRKSELPPTPRFYSSEPAQPTPGTPTTLATLPTLPTPSPLRALERDWRDRRRSKLAGMIEQRRREAEDLRRLKEERRGIMVDLTGPVYRSKAGSVDRERVPTGWEIPDRKHAGEPKLGPDNASLVSTRSAQAPRRAPLAPLLAPRQNLAHPWPTSSNAIRHSDLQSPHPKQELPLVTRGLQPLRLCSESTPPFVTDENGSRRRRVSPSDGVKETIRDDVPRQCETGSKIKPVTETSTQRKQEESKLVPTRSGPLGFATSSPPGPSRIDPHPMPPGKYPLPSSSHIIVYPYSTSTPTLASPLIQRNQSSTRKLRSPTVLTPSEKIHILRGGEIMLYEDLTDPACDNGSVGGDRGPGTSWRKGRGIELRLASWDEWSDGDRKRWDVVAELVVRLKKVTERAVYHDPIGDLRIMCNVPPDVHLHHRYLAPSLQPDLTLPLARSSNSDGRQEGRDFAQGESKHALDGAERRVDEQRVKVKIVYSRADASLDVSLYRKRAGARFKSRRLLEMSENGVGRDRLADALARSNGWDAIEVEAVKGLISLQTLWAAIN